VVYPFGTLYSNLLGLGNYILDNIDYLNYNQVYSRIGTDQVPFSLPQFAPGPTV
jgi:hypothetical protein